MQLFADHIMKNLKEKSHLGRCDCFSPTKGGHELFHIHKRWMNCFQHDQPNFTNTHQSLVLNIHSLRTTLTRFTFTHSNEIFSNVMFCFATNTKPISIYTRFSY